MAGPFIVMAGLGPAIHDYLLRGPKSWMPAPRAGMTTKATEPVDARPKAGHDDKAHRARGCPAQGRA
jgi:hypothetical protein